MKKQLFNPALLSKNHLPNVVSRRIFGSHRHGRCISAAYKSDADLSEEDKKAIIEGLQTRMQEALNKRAPVEDLAAIKTAIGDFSNADLIQLRELSKDGTGAMAKIIELGTKITEMKASIDTQVQDLSIRSQIEKWMGSKDSSGIEVRSLIKDIASKKRRDLPALDIDFNFRAANSPMTPANTLGGSAYLPKPEFIPGVVDILRQAPTFWDFLKKGSAGSSVLVWVNKKVPGGSGGASWLHPGVLKPGVSFTMNTETSNAKKIAVSGKMATELLQDVTGFASYVEDELKYQLYIKASETLLVSGDATVNSEEPTSVINYAVPFVGLALGVRTTSPNNYDAIAACVAQLRKAKFKGEIAAVVHSIDLTNMRLTKAISQGQVFIPPATGASHVEDDEMTQGSVLVFAPNYYNIKIWQGFSLSWGWENDDFTKNLVTVLAEMRLHQYVSENHLGFAIYDTFDNIKAGIVEPVPAP
jgi:hypothetical protein